MPNPKSRSIANVSKRIVTEDKKLRAKVDKAQNPTLDAKNTDQAALDSFVNFGQKLGIGADNALSSAGYGFNPISRVRTTLEWIHRGSWLGGVAVDTVANDMTRGGVDLLGDLDPEDMEQIEESATQLQIWTAINDNTKWARLYGGSIAVMMIDGQDMKTPLRIETIGKGQFKGLLVLDRWMVEPSLSDLVTEAGPDIGMPKYYRITADAPALPRLQVHYSRVIRQEGIKLPYWQRLQENMWGISVLERLYDRMIAFDSASTGAAQLVYKAYIRTYAIEGLREIVSAGGPAMEGLVKYVDMMRRFQGIEGITLLDSKDKLEAMQHSAFAGLSDALTQFAQQLSGALQIPLVRLFGQSPSGFSTGDTDLRMYYDSINQQQVMNLKVGVTKVYRGIAQSEGIKLPKGFKIEFRSLWQLTETEKADTAVKVTSAVAQAQESGLVSDKVAMQELRQSSKHTGIYSNISESDIKKADDVPGPPDMADLGEVMKGEAALQGAGNAKANVGRGTEALKPGNKGGTSSQSNPKAKGKATEKEKDKGKSNTKAKSKDTINAVGHLKRLHDLHVVVENSKGTIRTGFDWETVMPEDYGYIQQTEGADGDQVDCYVGPNPESSKVWVINQLDADTELFDEHKVMLGFTSMNDAIATYIAGFNDGKAWNRLGSISYMTMPEFKDWLSKADLKQKAQ